MPPAMDESRPSNRRRWALTQEAFDALLQRLGPDRESAAVAFESLRRKLLQFFTYEACAFPDRWADETLDRVAKRLSEGSPIEEVPIYARGVARMVLREARLLENRERNLRTLPLPASPPDERSASCLDECLAVLAPAARDLVEHYYLGFPMSRASARKALAGRLGINMDALRGRALRIRRQLEACLEDCLEKHVSGGTKTDFSSDKDKSSDRK
jgi:hypothetical protein